MASLQQQQQNASGSNNLAQDPLTYQKLQEAFIKDLRHFHDTKGSSFKNIPKINGREVDLYKLYTLVTAHGGWIQVNSRNEWAWLSEEFHLPSGCVNSGVGLKQIYLRFLDKYEKIHFLGEDGHHADNDDDDSRHRKFNVRSLNAVPLTYNHHQHNVNESLREYNGLSSDLYKSSNYDKLALSLLSPLPNEQDFAINVCTFLSNEGRHTLRLDKYPRLITHLLAHAGVYDSPGTRQLFIECYSRVRNYSINSFWQDVLDAQDVLDLTDERVFAKDEEKQQTQDTIARLVRRRRDRDRKNKENEAAAVDGSHPMEVEQTPCDRLDENGIEILEERFGGSTVLAIDETTSSSTSSSTFKDQNQNSIKFEDDDKDLFCVGRTLGTQDPYGQRVLQIALILRNLSFSPENAVVLGKSRSFLRFVLLCVRARWSNLHQLGFDILGNIANEIVLKEAGERLTGVILHCVTKGINSPDRFIIISCLEILNKISQQDANEETVALRLDDNVYEVICRFLALSDIALLVYTLECLYALTSMGERPCSSVARVRGAIDTLVALVTVEAQSYGPKACILMRVVETVSSVPASSQAQQPDSSQQSATQPSQANDSPNSPANRRIGTALSSPVVTVSSGTSVSGSQASSSHSSVFVTSSTANATTTPAFSPAPTQVQIQIPQQKQIIIQTQQSQIKMQTQQKPQSTTAQSQAAQIQQQTVVTKNSSASNSRPGTPKNASAAAKAASTLQMQHTHQQIIQENEQFALGWLRANFELHPGIKIEQEELYKKYLGCCTKIGRRGVIAPIHFPRCVRSVFGVSVGPNPIKGETVGPMFYEGIKLRANPGPICYPSQNAVVSTNQTTTTTTTTSNVLISGNSNNVASSPKVTVAHPHLSQALLNQQSSGQSSSTVQTPQLQTVQVIVKEDPRSATSSSIIKSLLATKVTVAGDSASSATITSSTTCVSSSPVAVTNATSISANQLLTASQVAQRQQQQRQQQLQQQTTGVTPTKTYSNAKQKQTIVAIKKVQRLNGAKVVVANNGEKAESKDTDSNNSLTPSQQQTQLAIASITAPTTCGETNHQPTNQLRIIRPNQVQQQTILASSSPPNSSKRITVPTAVGEDSDSTNNSLASSSGIGGSRDCSGVGAEEENSLTSFEGILLNGVPSNLEIDTQEDGSSKDSTSVGSKEKLSQGMMLADLLERKVEKEPIMNGVLGKKDIVENHIKKLKTDVTDGDIIEQTLQSLKRPSSTEVDDSPDTKKPKYANGTSSPDPMVIDSTAVSSVKSEETEDEKEEKVKVSSTAANLYAALAADLIDDEMEEPVEETVKEEIKTEIKEEIKEEPQQLPIVPMNQIVLNQSQVQQVQVQQQSAQAQSVSPQIAITQQQLQQQLQQQGLLVGGRQIVVQQNNQLVTIPAQALKGKLASQATQPQVLQVQQGQAGQQTHYVISGGVGGQNYVLAQPQTALMQGQSQTVLVAQQQGSNAKTIIILQPQATAQQQTQKVLAVTPQGQQVVVTQVPRPLLQSSAISNVPPPLVSTSGVNQTSIVVSNAVAQQIQQSQFQSQAVLQQTTNTVRVLTPTATPTSTPPPTRPATPQQTSISTTKPMLAVVSKDSKKTANLETSNGNTASGKPSTSQEADKTSSNPETPTKAAGDTPSGSGQPPKTITIKIDPNMFLCEWRGCLKQFKTPRKVFMHVCETHCPTGTDESLCLWSSCDSLKRRRFSLMTHLFDRHCCDEVMSARRKQLTLSGKTEVTTTTATPATHHPGYAPNAALHAIKRHALEFVNPKELMQRPSKPAAATTSSSSPRPGQNPPPEQDDNEGPVTKSIRLTAALILRNLVIYSAHGRRHLRVYEPHLAGVALSNVESSRTIAQVLYDMNDQSSSGHR